jgi:hypothetical protein
VTYISGVPSPTEPTPGPAPSLVDRYTRPAVPIAGKRLGAVALVAPMMATFALFFAVLAATTWLYLLALFLIALTVMAVVIYRRVLPAELRSSSQQLVVEPPASPGTHPPARFRIRGRLFDVSDNGICFDQELIAGSLVTDDESSDAARRDIPWTDVRRWVVCADSGGASVYEIERVGQDPVRLFRPRGSAAAEAELLDTIQQLGCRPVVVAAKLGLPGGRDARVA